MNSQISNLKFVSAASVSLEAFAAAFTSAFEGYQHPVRHDGMSLARRVRVEQYDLANSLVVFEGGEAVGMAVLAVRGQRGWVGGFGVVPRWRGRGLSRELMSALLERARAAELRRLSLEVLAVNVPARRLYERAGMRVTRDLLVLERTADYVKRRVSAPREATADELLKHYWRLHPEPPAWQRELPALLAADLRGLYVGGLKRPRAYALLADGSDGNIFLSDLAAADPEDAEALCAALGRVPGPLKVINEPEDSPFAAPLLAHGFREVTRQHEMTLEL